MAADCCFLSTVLRFVHYFWLPTRLSNRIEAVSASVLQLAPIRLMRHSNP